MLKTYKTFNSKLFLRVGLIVLLVLSLLAFTIPIIFPNLFKFPEESKIICEKSNPFLESKGYDLSQFELFHFGKSHSYNGLVEGELQLRAIDNHSVTLKIRWEEVLSQYVIREIIIISDNTEDLIYKKI